MRAKASAKKDVAAKHLLEQLRRGARWHAGERIGVAVSGGADSVALLRLLLEAQEELGLVLSVVHLNHRLRGSASDGDEKFVAELARKHGLEFHGERVDVGARAKREKANLEDAARRTRYEFFARLTAERKVERVAVAHTADDQAETVLAHILRGTGLAGLGGIHPETECVVRPLLRVRRAELRAYLRAKKQKWREDASNRDTTRTRARVRSKLLPLLERQFQPEAVAHLVSLAELAREDEALLARLAQERCEAFAKGAGGTRRILLRDLLAPLREKEPNAARTEVEESKERVRRARTDLACSALTRRMLRRLIAEAKRGTAAQSPRSAQITAQHVAAVLELAQHGESGKLLQLPGGVEVRRGRDELAFGAGKTQRARGERQEQAEDPAYERQIDFQLGEATVRVPAASCVLRFRVIDWPANRGDTKESGPVLDRERVREPLVLRNWRPGDRLQPPGHQQAHKLARLFNEQRISRWARRGWPVLTSGATLVWARGFPVAAGFGASEKTREAILISEAEL